MALIILYDTQMKRDRIINTDFIFHCFDHEGGVRINYAQGGSGTHNVMVAGTVQDFAKRIGATRVE